MPYSISLITDPSQADEVIKIANRDIRNLEAREGIWKARSENSAEDTDEFNKEMTDDQNKLDEINAKLPTLPEGSQKKKEAIGQKMTLEAKIYNRAINKVQKNVVTILEREYDMEVNGRSLEAAKEFKGLVEARKAELLEPKG